MIAALGLLAASLVSTPASAERPNIVIVLADDVGYGDLSCYGAQRVRTPNLDLLAAKGVRFTDAHSPAAVCTPTRYSLLTGEYSFRNPKGAGILSGVAPLAIDQNQATLPKILKEVGYRTAVVGKWHLGLGETTTDYNKTITAGPKEVGFDRSFIIPATGDRVPCVFVEDGKVRGYDASDPIAVSYQKQVGNEPTGKDHPELLKIKPLVGHAGTIVNGVSRIGWMSGGKKARWVDEDIADTLTAEAVKFIKKKDSRPFFLYLATHDVHAPQLPNKRFEGANSCGLRGFTLAQLDWTVGEVIKALDRKKVARNTIVIFTSDNGGVDNDGYGDPRENLNGHMVNGDLRDFKYSLYEGGHRVPFILRWPERAKPGQVSDALLSQTDLMASIASLVGRPLRDGEGPDSFDMKPALTGGKDGRDELVIHLGGANSPLGFRSGNWMLIPRDKQGFELYDLKVDLGEHHDIAQEHPELVDRLAKRLRELVAAKGTRPGWPKDR